MEISSIESNGFQGVESVLAVAIKGWRVEGEALEEELLELGHLISTAGGTMEDVVIQDRNKPHPGTMIGPGKVQEVAETAASGGYDMVVFNEGLKPAQHTAVSDEIPVDVMDRTDLILDIFAQRAQSRDAKLQVELAQLRHNLPRKRGWGWALARLGGGIGTRGPGEQKGDIKEQDIRERIHRLEDKVEEIREKLVTSHDTLYERNEAPIVTVLNKVDKVPDEEVERKREALSALAPNPIAVSALEGDGIAELRDRVDDELPPFERERLVLPMCDDAMSLVSWVHDNGHVEREEYDATQVDLEFEAPPSVVEQVRSRAADLDREGPPESVESP